MGQRRECLKARIKRSRLARKLSRSSILMPALGRFMSLPAELRLEIYEHALTFDGNLVRHRRVPNHHHCRDASCPFIKTGILCVNSQINREAVPVFYERNMIATGKQLLCRTFLHGPHKAFDPTMIQHLQTTALFRLFCRHCMFYIEGKHPKTMSCAALVTGLTNKTLPRLKTVRMDCNWTLRTLQEFCKSIRTSNYDVQLTCTGLFELQLSGTILTGIDFQVRADEALREWCHEMEFSADVRNGPLVLENLRNPHVTDMVLNISTIKMRWLLAFHDWCNPQLIPVQIASIWPSGSHVDYRAVEWIRKPGFQAEFGQALMDVLEMGYWRQWLMVRR